MTHKILILGKNGQVGWELIRTMASLGDITALGREDLDLINIKLLKQTIRANKPDIVINAVANTAVDLAESQPELPRMINAVVPGEIAKVAKELGAVFIHYSTDFVFDGSHNRPYKETDKVNPINVYGKTKLDGEYAIQEAGGSYLILRTSMVLSTHKNGYLTKIIHDARNEKYLEFAIDQVCSPTWARFLAEVTSQIIAQPGQNSYEWLSKKSGVYHAAGSGSANKLELAEEIISNDPFPELHVYKKLIGMQSKDIITPAIRPSYSALNCDKFFDAFNIRIPDWKIGIALAMGTINLVRQQ